MISFMIALENLINLNWLPLQNSTVIFNLVIQQVAENNFFITYTQWGELILKRVYRWLKTVMIITKETYYCHDEGELYLVAKIFFP